MVHLKLTLEERSALAQAAADQGVSIQRYLLECAAAINTTTDGGQGPMTMTARQDLARDLLEVRRQLAGAANNVNQIAKVAHTGGLPAVQADALSTFSAVRETAQRVFEVLDQMLPSQRARR